ncbi:uncharacterized protein LOC117793856 [Drosophila innubila]|uniref:uncharacterized protein LOC117793856 n=1 Tax=Drosophila innubila TaxID=198719 RepID=UPI00148C2ED6|nr:uncharacterized protein LOC117793856 [Drosophila innubila]
MSRARAISLLLTLYWLCLSRVWGYYSLEVGDPCPTQDYRSSCQPAPSCKTLKQFIESKRLTRESVLNCGFTITDEKICCPLETEPVQMRSSPENTTATTTTTTTASPPWLSIFNTNREYLERSVPIMESHNPESIVPPSRSTGNDDACQAPLYEGDCMPVSKCSSIDILLSQQRLRNEDVYTCRAGTTEEIICCPISVPLQPRAQIGTETRVGIQPTPVEVLQKSSKGFNQGIEQAVPATATAVELLVQYKYLAALAYPNARFDGHLHRCTAILLASQLLLTSAGCGRPSHAVFGVADLQDVDEEDDDLVDIANISVYRKDLALMRLPQPHQGEQASVCSSYEQTRWQTTGHLVASGWAKGNDSDCPLYELPMRLLPSDACKDIANSEGIQDLPSRHMCVEPMNPALLRATNSSSCVPCPSAVGSVLHLLSANGSRCVLGVASPTGDNCHADVMYYTSLVDRQLFKFVEDLRLMP